MSRPIVLSNGDLHIGLNECGLVNDFYFPYVGLENHAAAESLRHRIGVYVNGKYSWIDDGSWTFSQDYPHSSLISHTRAHNHHFGLTLEFDDTVDATHAAFLRSIHIVNRHEDTRTVKLFMHQVFCISNSKSGDTAQYLPGQPAILHYKGHRAFVVSGKHSNGDPFDQFSVGIYGIEGKEGTFRDAEDGALSGNPVEHGSVDSVIGFDLELGPHDSKRVEYTVSAGTSVREAASVNNLIQDEGVSQRLLQTDVWWQQWLIPAERCIKNIPKEYRTAFRKSLMVLKSQIDNRGAIMASTDTTMLNYSRDAYAYCWPRDAALILWPLIRMGYTNEPKQFFDYIKRILHTEGYLMHKYQADGALGTSWHPYVHNGDIMAPPIQEDETATVLFMLGQFFNLHEEQELLHDYYLSLVQPMANFLADYIDSETKLPKPSYDLWEEVFLTSTYTTAITHAGLRSAIDLAERMGANQDAVRWQVVADEMKRAAQKQLYNPERGFFYKGYLKTEDGISYNDQIDLSSFYGAFMFNLFDSNGDEVKTSLQTIGEVFNAPIDAPTGLPRYERDQYNLADPDSLGNPWFITTLWIAQYLLEQNQTDAARGFIDWTVDRMMPSGVLSEQIDPRDNTFLSVAPLTWSQAELLNSLLDLVIEPAERQP